MEVREMTFEDWLGKDNELGQTIMENKYRKNHESFSEWLHRVSGGDPDLQRLIYEKKILLGGRTMSNRGTDSPASYFNCLTGDTKIFTSDGIKPIGELAGQTVNVLSNGAWKSAEIKCFGEQEVHKLRVKRFGQTKEIGTTENHIWLVGKKHEGYSKVTTTSLRPGMQLAYSTVKCYRKYKPSPFGIAHGFHFGDGDHVDKRNIRTNICKGKEELLQYFMPDTVTTYNDTLIVNGVPHFFNQAPQLNESPAYLYGWLAGYFAADGSVSKNGQCVLCSINRDNLEIVRNVLCVLGLPAGIIRSQQRISNLTGEMGTVYILTINRYYLNENFFILSKHRERFINAPVTEPMPWIVESVSDVVGKELVYCAVVPDTHTFTLDNNILTHNCYSHGFVDDSYRDIMQTAMDIGLTFKGEGGQGLSLSKLRPQGSPVGKQYASDGILPFMRIFNEVTAGTSQGGARKGALMISIDARHKEAEAFIRIKSQEGQIEKANLSLEIDDEFMEAVRVYYDTGEVLTLHEKRNYSGHMVEYDVVPIEVFKALVDNCYDWADPAALFVNRLRNYNLMQFDNDYQIETTNPCGEQPLPKHGACCLASLNLSEFVHNPYTDKAYFDTSDFVEAVQIGIRTLDRLIDENYHRHPLKEQQEMSYNYRNIGLGVFGYATMLMKLGYRYGSDEALKFTDTIFALMFRAAVLESNRLAGELGPYPKYKDCVWDSDIMKAHFPQEEIDRMRETGLRNCSLLSIAPTGSIGTMLGESGGAEPEFAMKFTRRTVGMTDGEDTYFTVFCKAAREYMEVNKTEILPSYFVAAPDIPWPERIKTQAIMQKHVDTGISSTVNLPNSATKDDIAMLYLVAWEEGLKGVTIFRDGCKRMPILSTEKKEEPHENEGTSAAFDDISQLPRGYVLEASDNLIGKKRKLMTGCGSLHCTAFFDPETGDLMETYLSKGSTGGCNNFMIGLSRMISLAARSGCDIVSIIDQLNSSGVCPSYAVRKATMHDTSKGSCCPVAIANALKEMWQEIHDDIHRNEIFEEKPMDRTSDKPIVEFTSVKPTMEFTASNRANNDAICPQCGEQVIHEGGCDICKNCGWSKCN